MVTLQYSETDWKVHTLSVYFPHVNNEKCYEIFVAIIKFSQQQFRRSAGLEVVVPQRINGFGGISKQNPSQLIGSQNSIPHPKITNWNPPEDIESAGGLSIEAMSFHR